MLRLIQRSVTPEIVSHRHHHHPRRSQHRKQSVRRTVNPSAAVSVIVISQQTETAAHDIRPHQPHRLYLHRPRLGVRRAVVSAALSVGVDRHFRKGKSVVAVGAASTKQTSQCRPDGKPLKHVIHTHKQEQTRSYSSVIIDDDRLFVLRLAVLADTTRSNHSVCSIAATRSSSRCLASAVRSAHARYKRRSNR